MSGFKVKKNKESKSEIVFVDTGEIDDYYPFLTYGINPIKYNPKNFKGNKEIKKKIKNKLNIDLRKVGFKGRIIADLDNNEILKYEKPDDIIEYNSEKIFKQFNNIKMKDIESIDVKYIRPNDESREFKEAFNLFKKLVSIDYINRALENTVYELLKDINLKDNNMNFEHDIYVHNEWFSFRRENTIASEIVNKFINKLGFYYTSRNPDIEEIIKSTPDHIHNSEVMKILDNEILDKKINNEKFCKSFSKILRMPERILETKGQTPDIFSFRLKNGIKPEDLKEDIIEKNILTLKSI